MKLEVYINNIYHGDTGARYSEDGLLQIHVPESITRNIGNKYFHIDLIEKGA